MFQIFVIFIVSFLIPEGSLPLLVSHYSTAQTESFETYIEKARQAINENRFTDAKNELKAAFKIKSDSSKAYLLLAKVCRSEGHNGDATKYVRDAINFQPDYGEAYYFLGALLFETNKLKDAQQMLQSGLDKASQYAPLYVLSGDVELAISRPTKGLRAFDPRMGSAIKYYEEALRLASPSDNFQSAVRERLTGLKNYVESVLHEDDPSYVKAKLLNNPQPGYTDAARNARFEGEVKLGININAQGEVTSAQLFSHVGYGLDEEADKAARRLRFLPATKAGKPMPSWSRVEIQFRLGPR